MSLSRRPSIVAPGGGAGGWGLHEARTALHVSASDAAAASVVGCGGARRRKDSREHRLPVVPHRGHARRSSACRGRSGPATVKKMTGWGANLDPPDTEALVDVPARATTSPVPARGSRANRRRGRRGALEPLDDGPYAGGDPAERLDALRHALRGLPRRERARRSA